MQRLSTTSRVAAIGAAMALALVVGLGAAWGNTGSGRAATGPIPGDTDMPFWPHETGVLVGTSETFVDMRADGSYYDPSLGRRVRLPVDSNATRPDDRPFYRGISAALAPTSPDDRPFARSLPESKARMAPSGVAPSRGFDWEDGVIGGAFGVALALLGMGAILIAHRRRNVLRSA